MNCVICAIAKNENAYLYEWAQYHLSIGFDHIYIYDNNDVDGEHIHDVFRCTPIEPSITIIDVRGQRYVQKSVYNECYRTADFDWCAFIDIDEFITLDGPQSISAFLSDKGEWEAVHLNWMCYGDGNHICYSNGDVRTRFIGPWKENVYYCYTNIEENKHIKSIIHKGLSIDWQYDIDGWESNPHTPYGLTKVCNTIGKPIVNSPFSEICYGNAYISHYTTKSIEEYATKVTRQCADCDNTLFYSFPKFFRVNSVTIGKVLWLKKHYPQVRIWDCIKEHFRYMIVNYNLPFRFLFRSLSR